jgi:hypothetical protein
MDCAAFFTFSPYGDWLLAARARGGEVSILSEAPFANLCQCPRLETRSSRPRRGTSEGPVLISIRNRKEMSSSGCFRGKTGG